jgi:oligopeptide transport system ATP-binding protein
MSQEVAPMSASVRHEVVLKAENLVKHYPIKAGVLRRTVGHVKAVDGISFELYKGETLGIVGESGCGKSTLGRMLMRLEEPTDGKLTFDGVDVYSQKGADMRRLRRDIQIVFQDPYTSLNPRKTVGDIVGEPFEIHRDVVAKGGRRRRVQELLELVGLNPEHINRYPHQFSGGQRQRIGIARGVALNPKVIICDEPVSALDVSVQAQVVNLLEQLQTELGLAYIFIAHDLSVVRHISDRVGVMYLGKMVELGDEDQIYCRCPIPRCATCGSRSCLLGMCPARPIHQPHAGSIPAAGRRRKFVPSRNRCLSSVLMVSRLTFRLVTSPSLG